MRVGQEFLRDINQADRWCKVLAVQGTRYLYEYAMPSEQVYYRIGDTTKHPDDERSVSLARIPKWARDAVLDTI